MEIIDQRESSTVLRMGRRSYSLDNADELIRGGFERMVGAHSGEHSGIPLQLRLRLLYTYGQYKAGTSVFTVVMAGELAGGEQRLLRGQHAVFNWTDGQTDLQRAMALSLSEALGHARNWLAEHC